MSSAYREQHEAGVDLIGDNIAGFWSCKLLWMTRPVTVNLKYRSRGMVAVESILPFR